MKNEKILSTLIKKQIGLEKETADKLRELEQRVDSAAARLLIREMQLDTKKHAEILSEALRIMDTPKSFWDFTIYIDADKRVVKKQLEEHIKIEKKMMQQIEEEAEKSDDEALKLILKHFAEDEKKHHRYLETILNKAYKMDI